MDSGGGKGSRIEPWPDGAVPLLGPEVPLFPPPLGPLDPGKSLFGYGCEPFMCG